MKSYQPPPGYTLTPEITKTRSSPLLMIIAAIGLIASVIFCWLWINCETKSDPVPSQSSPPINTTLPVPDAEIDLGLNNNQEALDLDLGLDTAPMGVGYPINSPPPPMENRQGPPPTIKVGRTNTDEGYNFNEPMQMDNQDVGPRAANRRTKGAPFSF